MNGIERREVEEERYKKQTNIGLGATTAVEAKSQLKNVLNSTT